ncbi:response regulator [Novosphingobium sp. FSY-8]|uniref:Response regulator n=1 Tax=Novosphingobium ovatum TaxID=1908523 RepID=A0ABW9XDQ7_9SPHN|nr:response regulator [Novosphingobium ovatum]NBC36672.1 response regulator [Novosphingobium ovatum]
MRLLLVEDDPMIGEAVQAALKDAAHAVDWARDGATAREALACGHYDAMLLDLGLPDGDGLTLLAELRGRRDRLPVLILTARDSIEDRLKGLDGGADDYLVKPFAMAELLARLRAILRRQGGQGEALLGNGAITLNPATRVATAPGTGDIALSAREFALLHALLLRPGAILSRGALEDRIYGWGEEVESNAVEFLIHALRRKLGRDAIRNVRGVGWMVVKEA